MHNTQVTEELIKQGVEFIKDIKESRQKVIIRSHGVSKEIYKIANKNGIELIDLTCPKVLNIHKIAEKYANENYYIFLTGQLEHPETIGTISFCGKNYSIIQNENDIEYAIEKFNESVYNGALLISQTTFSLATFDSISDKIKLKIPNIKIENTICNY